MELDKIPGPKVVLASIANLDAGFSRKLFLEWSASPNNIVILPDRGTPGSLCRKLYDEWLSQKDLSPLPNMNFQLSLNVFFTISFAKSYLTVFFKKKGKSENTPGRR